MNTDVISTLSELIREFRLLADSNSVSPDSLGVLLAKLLDIVRSVNTDTDAAARAAADAHSAANSAYERANLALSKAEKALKNIDTITSADISDQIDSLQEVLNFLAGIRDDEQLQAKLASLATDINALSGAVSGLSTSKVDKVAGKGLSTNDYTDDEKSKLSGIAAGANKYVHPATHPASIITEDATHRFMTDTEREKLKEIAEGANNYKHPDKHPASIITEDATHRFMTDTEREKLKEIAEGANNYKHPATHPASMIEQSDERMFVTKEFLDAAKRVVANGLEVLPVTMPDYYTVPSAPQRPDEGIFLIKGDPYDYFLVNKYGSVYDDSDYNRYVVYMGAEVPQARTDRLYMCSGRVYTYDGTGLVAFATTKGSQSGSGDGGSFSGMAKDLETDAQHRFVSDAEKKKWNTPQLLPLDGICENRAAMPTYGIWAFPDENGMWTVDGDFSGLGLLRTDYCDRVGIDQSAYIPKQTVLFMCKCYDSKCRKLYYSDAEDKYAVKPYAQLKDLPKSFAIGIAGATFESDTRNCDIECASSFTKQMLESIRVGDTLTFNEVDGVAKIGNLPNGVRGNILVTNAWDDDGSWTVGFSVWGLDYLTVGRMWWGGSCAVVRINFVGEW